MGETTVRVGLISFDGRANYRSFVPGDNAIHEHVDVSLDRDRFNALGKPGYLDVTYRPAPSLPADHTTTSEENRPW